MVKQAEDETPADDKPVQIRYPDGATYVVTNVEAAMRVHPDAHLIAYETGEAIDPAVTRSVREKLRDEVKAQKEAAKAAAEQAEADAERQPQRTAPDAVVTGDDEPKQVKRGDTESD